MRFFLAMPFPFGELFALRTSVFHLNERTQKTVKENADKMLENAEFDYNKRKEALSRWQETYQLSEDEKEKLKENL